MDALKKAQCLSLAYLHWIYVSWRKPEVAGVPCRPESAQGTRGLDVSSEPVSACQALRGSEKNQEQLEPINSWAIWRCVGMSGNYFIHTNGRTNQDDFSQRSGRKESCWPYLPNISHWPLSILPATDLIRPPPHFSWIPAPPMGRSLSSSMLPRTPLSAPEEPSNLYNMCISLDPRPLPRHGLGCLLPALGINRNHSSSGQYIPHPAPPLPTPHLALCVPNPFKLF